jgi:hypothetical protein
MPAVLSQSSVVTYSRVFIKYSEYSADKMTLQHNCEKKCVTPTFDFRNFKIASSNNVNLLQKESQACTLASSYEMEESMTTIGRAECRWQGWCSESCKNSGFVHRMRQCFSVNTNG